MSATRSVLVTGASRGIGRAIALRLARGGWHVYAGVRTDVAAKALAEESDAITPVELDVTVPEHVAALDAVLPERLDALVNNVGIGVGKPVEALTPEDVRGQFEANLVGPLAVTSRVLPRLRRAQGRILFISSVNGRVSFRSPASTTRRSTRSRRSPTACASSSARSASRSGSSSRASSRPTRGPSWTSSSTTSNRASPPS